MRMDTSGGLKYFVVISTWLAFALVAGVTGVTAMMRPPVPQLIIFGGAGLILLIFWRAGRFRAWIFSLPPRALVLPHVVRFVGIYFLVLAARGDLPRAFAVPGGWGDIAAATLAVLISMLNAETVCGRRVYLAWNILGLCDILFVVATATRLFFANPDSMGAMLRLPLSLLPTFVVPLILALHVMLFVRLRPATMKE